MSITKRIQAKVSTELALSWAGMEKALRKIVAELKSKGVKMRPYNTLDRSPGDVTQTFCSHFRGYRKDQVHFESTGVHLRSGERVHGKDGWHLLCLCRLRSGQR